MSDNPNSLPTPVVINRREIIRSIESIIATEMAEETLEEFEWVNALATERMFTGEDVHDHDELAEVLRVHGERTRG